MNEKDHILDPEESAKENQEQPTAEEGTENTVENGQTPDSQANPDQEIEALRMQYDELKDKYLRLYAEFDNYKKRAIKEKLDFMATAAQDTLTALLPVLDDFDRAKKAAEAANSTEPFSEGVSLVYQKLSNTLKNKGLTPMESNGKPFDPEFHEALAEIPAPSEDLKGKIIDTVETGYLLKEKIIRHAKVVVGK